MPRMSGEDSRKNKCLRFPPRYTPSLQPFTVPVLDIIFTTFIIYYLPFIISLSVTFSSTVLSSLPLNYISFQLWISTAQILVEGASSLVCCKHFTFLHLMAPSFCTTQTGSDLFLSTVSPEALLTSLIFPLVTSFLGCSFPGYSVAPRMEAFPDFYLASLSFSEPL